ncbi:MAG TPA: NAD(P)/FAD-dependent oxidoreductase [Thermoleophilaceae bacterium]|nr:NAD(P)/FAD-dependent oxidoreductase [Thermoleophilaceae bacterium]
MSERHVVIVGAGPAGIAAAVALKDRGLRPVVVDQADSVASSWRRRYDRLRLNTCRPFSHLPKRRFPRGTPMFPSRDQLVEHLERHAAEDGIELKLGTRVERIDRRDGGWALETSAGELRAPQVITATGYEQEPIIPDWSGRDAFKGELIHSAQYRNPEPFKGRRVLVVGPGCSGMEIAYDLAEGGASKVWLAVRTPPNIVLRSGPGGLPGDVIAVALLHLPARIGDAAARFGRRQDLGDLTEYGLPVPDEGVFTRLRRTGQAPAILDEEVIEAIKAGRIEIVRGVTSLDETAVELTDGARVEPDAVICATGYSRALEPLVGHLGVLDERGVPRVRGAREAAPGLRFIGYVPRPGGIGYAGKESRRAARAIARELSAA